MAVPGAIQALIAAFLFGILFNTASTALVLYVKSNGSAIYRDGLRLVLILFFLSSSTWALVEFLSTLIDPSAVSTCQVAVIFSSLFDQLGRVFVEQYLVWAVPKGNAKTVFSLIPQILVFGRFFVGIAFTAVTRTQFKPTCAPISSVQAVSITTIALDAVIIGLLLIQSFSSDVVKSAPGPNPITLNHKAARLIVVGVVLWWGTSVTSLLGLESIDLFYKTALPGIGLTVLVALATLLSQAYTVPREAPRRPDSPISRARDLSSSGSAGYPPSRYEDLKGTNGLSISAFAARPDTARSIRRNGDGTFPTISRPITAGSDTNGNPIQEQLSTATNPLALAPVLSTVPPLPENWAAIKSVSSRSKGSSKSRAKGEKLLISNPIFISDENLQSSFKKIPTIDLAEAATNDRLRREKYAERTSTLVAQRPAPRPPSAQMFSGMVALEQEVAGELESIDAIRRRSPRQPEPAALTTPFRVIKPGEPIRIPIPRPPQRDQVPSPPKPEPVKTPLQRRPTTGLPSNPRAQTLKSTSKETESQKTQTVMFINNIVYSDPNAVGDIIQEATKIPQPPDSADSVVNRPRPIPRKSDQDRQVFPAEVSPNRNHRRSKSGGSIVSRKSILQVVPGSPTGLPSLPPIPPITASMAKSVPNNTKSMTVQEKMDLLYSSQPSGPTITEIISKRRRSSLPNLSPKPDTIEDEQLQPPLESVPGPGLNIGTRESKDSKRSTARTSSLLGITVGSQIADLAASFSDRNPVTELGNPWLPGIPAEDATAVEGVKRRSSPVIPVRRQTSVSTTRSETRFGDDETLTNWGSVYSPAVPVSRQNARSTYIRKGSRNDAILEEIPIMMLNEEPEDLGGNGALSGPNNDRPLSSRSDASQGSPAQFHHRPGDDCPTFSARKDKARPRKMPPPTPLLLSGQGAKRQVIVQAAEPSPVESPRAAYEAIQAQLRNFEKSEQDSMQDPGQRLALLENLEQEMGQLESKWQAKHENLGRDSMSTIRTSMRDSRPPSLAPTISRPPSQRSSIAHTIAERRASRRSRMQRGGGEGAVEPSSQNSSRSPKRQYIGQTPELLMKHNNLNVLSVSKVDLGNPSPPETDGSDLDEMLEESIGKSGLEASRLISPTHALWSLRRPAQRSATSWLWEPQTQTSHATKILYESPIQSYRPATRKHLTPLTIESTRLWRNDKELSSMKSPEGLWNNQPFTRHFESVKALSRPVTVRPPRRQKRITLLPDIIENPEPLPNKRGTLGIFQFPWGEKSENATIQYRPSQAFTAMPGTMTTGNPVDNAVLSAQLSDFRADEYSSSFFDDFEESDNFSDYSDRDDDEFDETTLWEIASLLQTDQVPSKNSLLPMPLQPSPSMNTSDLADFIADMPSDYEDEDESEALFEYPDLAERSLPVQEKIKSTNIENALLWSSHDISENNNSFGLPQHDDWSLTYNQLVTVSERTSRAQLRAEDLVPVTSTKLWAPMAKQPNSPDVPLLWSLSRDYAELNKEFPFDQPLQPQHNVLLMWSKPDTVTYTSTFGLPQPEAHVWQQLVSQMTSMKRSAKPRLMDALPSINSSTLWSQNEPITEMTLWVAPPISREIESKALFSPGASTSSCRTTEHLPAALSLTKRSCRPKNAALEPLTSTALWSLEVSNAAKPSAVGLWRSAMKRSQEQMISVLMPVASSLSSGLWKQPVQVEASRLKGLFDPKVTRSDFRRTSEPPAAILTSVRPRLTREDAPTLTSHNLWASHDASDVTTKDVKTGFLWQRKLSANDSMPTLFRLDAGRTDYRTTSAEPAALEISRRPRTTQQPLHTLQSTSLWDNSQISRSDVDWISVCTPAATILSRGGRVPLRHRYQPTIVYNANWDAALAEALAASKPRGQTLENDSGLRLHNNVTEEKLSQPQDFDVVIRHPAFFGSFTSATENVHPALTGYRVDVIVRPDSLPAMAKEPTLPLLWRKPSESQARHIDKLWSLDKGTDTSALSLHARSNTNTYYYPMRGNMLYRPFVSETDLDSKKQGLWLRSRRNTSLSEKNWLDDTVNKRFSRIELRY
ncbi:hypothetical protein NPX13_g1461 [Xylaria arbuscula]|uniref:Uncharacterized protein n=1 Tax=Xylaria arbuscula TaxID=114810 RepID=A0A9W8NM26_9PEZI|nr:hypothetical protein NPX13_g1461 [Xylaria arbuscula]